jgi:glycosyltransferase involved in cell wall biosynthesis
MEATGVEILSYVATATPFALSHIARDRPDLIHAYFGLPGGGIARALRALTGVPYIISFRGRDVHGGRDREAGGIRGVMRLASCVAWRGASALIANSQGLRDIARNVLPGAGVSVIPNGVDMDRFTPTGPRPDGGPFRVLCVGRLEPYKGLSDLLEAVGASPDPVARQVHLDIVGDGTLRHALPDEARGLGLMDRVCFHGNLPPEAMPAAYRKAHLFVLPSYVEGMPNVILEAMASGLPVIATRIPGSEELVEDGVTGLLVAGRPAGRLKPGPGTPLRAPTSLLTRRLLDPPLRPKPALVHLFP